MRNPATNQVTAMPMTARLEIVPKKAAGLLPGDLGRRLLELLSPTSIAIMAGVVALWAGSHFVGIGEFVDVLLLRQDGSLSAAGRSKAARS